LQVIFSAETAPRWVEAARRVAVGEASAHGMIRRRSLIGLVAATLQRRTYSRLVLPPGQANRERDRGAKPTRFCRRRKNHFEPDCVITASGARS